jgi:hypothetical protein
MKMKEIQRRAKALGIRAARASKQALIRTIQSAEGNFPCFGTATHYCDQMDCCWREDCLKPRKQRGS